jgi:hypothetical protein
MDYFYSVVIGIAVIFLILSLIAVGIALQNQGKNEVFPKHQSPCPDGWEIDGSTCTVNTINGGGYLSTSTGITSGDPEENVWTDLTSGKFTHKPNATVCAKKTWANQKKIQWDGVSNYNQCND